MEEPWVLIPNAFTVDDALLARARETRTVTIFDPDKRRSQGPFRDKFAKDVARRIALQHRLLPILRGVVLRSTPGCEKQELHTDFNAASSYVKNRAGLLLSIMPGTKISLADRDIDLPPGSAFG